MADYACVLEAALGDDAAHFLCGWSMGGLVAWMVAARRTVAGLVLIEASLPGEIKGFRDDPPLRPGLVKVESVYGARDDGVVPRSDSMWAVIERARGISAGPVDCPVLVVGGHDFAKERAHPAAEHLGADLIEFPDLHHVALLHDARVLSSIAAWLTQDRSSAAD